ncbi:hypothetical protein [Streptomyces sp. NBC_00286]|uniref:hypothetical protein n=1 Tax=Streptomyces sp. NBC_00286 TaxID=2975701 RepID=UPI002E2D9E10|nr:hypothetical protein [Streptomyces sp. NBC_00286]
MTAGPLFSHPAAKDRPATAPTREDLIERERQRRLALIAARANEAPIGAERSHADADPKTLGPAEDAPVRESASPVSQSPETPIPDGFESESAWIAAQQAARAVAVAARDAGHPAPRLESLASDITADQLAKDLVAAVLPMPPLTAVQSLVEARRSLDRLLPPRLAVRARALLEGGLDQAPTGYGSTPEDGSDETWQLYADHVRLAGYVRVPVENQQRLMDSLPLPVVDDLIDDGHLSARAVPDDGDRRLYLQARLTPSQVDMEGVGELGWTDEQARREFRFRLACGDIAVLDETHGLTDEQRRMAADLAHVRSTGRIPSDLSAQKWLWPALERLAPQAPVNLRRDKAFGSWYVVRRMHRSLRAAHRAELSKDHKRADSLFKHARNDANALREVWTAGGWEAKNLIAYLLVLNGSGDEAYEQALEMISPVRPGYGLREDQLPGAGRVNLERNREVLRQLQRHREGDHVLNPYLVLDAPDGAPTELWKGKWRTLRRALDEDGEAMVNEAKDAIQMRERGQAPVEPFLLPLMPQKWANPAVDAAPTGAGAPPIPRRTAPPTQQEQDYARDQAAWGIVRAACQNVGLPAAAENCPPLPPESSSQ